MKATPKQVLVWTTGAVVASTGLLSLVRGYATVLAQAILLGSWGGVARFTSSQFADQHDGVVWAVAGVINSLLFFVPASVIYATTRKRRPGRGMALLVLWCLFYLALLLYLFPASDGP